MQREDAPSSHHLLDATTLWSGDGTGRVRRVVASKRVELLSRGWRHSVLVPMAREAHEIACGGVPIPASGGYRFVIDRARAARLIEAAQPDIVEAADPYVLGWAVLDATARLKVPAVAFCHSSLPALVRRWIGGRHLRGPPSRWAERRAAGYLARLYNAYSLVLAPSRAMMGALHAMGVPHAIHQPLGVDCSVFSPTANDRRWRDEFEDALGLKPATRLFVYAGRFAAEKNLDVLAEAARLLGPRYALIAVGAGPHPPRGDNVRVLAPEPDSARLARLLASCDAFVHAGDHETFGLAALEAMACGTPVVVNAAGGLGELAEGVGLTLQRNDPAHWAEAISACVSSPISALSWAALTRARSHDWPLIVGQIEAHYRAAMRRQPRQAEAFRDPPRGSLETTQTVLPVNPGARAPSAPAVLGRAAIRDDGRRPW